MAFVQFRKVTIRAFLVTLAVSVLALCACKSEPERRAESSAPSAELSSASAELAAGSEAPEVTFSLQNGKRLSLAALRGKPVVVYFYPKDDTPGCTVEAQGIRDAYPEFEKAGVHVLGVSEQGAESHRDFIDKHDLPFDLVVDVDGKVARAFGVPVNDGKAARQTFLIDAKGRVQKIWHEVKPGDHAQEILAELGRG